MKQHVLEMLAAKSLDDLSLVFTAQEGHAGCSLWEFAFRAGGVGSWLLCASFSDGSGWVMQGQTPQVLSLEQP